MKIRTKFSLLISGLFIILMIALTLLISTRMRSILLREMKSKGASLVMGLAANAEDALATEDDLYLVSFCKDATQMEGITYALIVDRNQIIRGANDIGYLNKGLKKILPFATEGDSLAATLGHYRGEEVYDFSIPITSKLRTRRGERLVKIGAAHLGISKSGIDLAIRNLQLIILGFSLIALSFGLLGAHLLSHFMTRPIKELTKGAEEIGKGNLDYRIPLTSRDELGDLTRAFNRMASSLKEKELIKDAFRRYVSHQVAEEIFKDPERYLRSLKGERRRVTVLFADIRGFTPLAERLEPESVVSLLNDYLTVMVGAVFDNLGTLDKFMGDAIMAVFGAPISYEDDVIRGVKTAIDIQRRIEELNRNREIKIRVGIGINFGEAVVGNIGSKQRMDYTVVGDSVNLAQRLESIAKGGEIIISEPVYQEIKDHFSCQPLPPVQVKGKREPVKIFRVVG
ncbi:hypothetical protein DRP53_01465 [candidate division WOR-3 bacterium]|uniref:HAMP domain-containing protein n=1 Tax=candidate division WOR-3 bacterium TaxID=2052148 RepID=A0A660SL70_UNCW3|nr:MAG: hypothetical protein DRP53_01465 [candidate division WOR-3 bacterium]